MQEALRFDQPSFWFKRHYAANETNSPSLAPNRPESATGRRPADQPGGRRVSPDRSSTRSCAPGAATGGSSATLTFGSIADLAQKYKWWHGSRRYKFRAMSGGLSRFRAEAAQALHEIAAGAPASDLESETLDCKEDPTTRSDTGGRVTGQRRDDEAARLITDAACCLANHHGGTIIVGIDDKARGAEALRGTALEAAWMRTRVGELSTPRLAVTCEVQCVGEARLLLIDAPRNEGMEPYAASVSKRGGQRRARRFGTDCQEMTTVAEMLEWARARGGYDWSAEPSGRPAAEARPAAIGALRDFLRESGEPDRAALGEHEDGSLLSRLQLLRPDGRLTRAGDLLLCGADVPRLRYTRRPALGARSVARVELADRGLTEELRAVLDVFNAGNRELALASGGFAEGSVTALPPGAVREALVNAVMHRDWDRSGPIAIDHAQDEIVIHSPGPFLEGVTENTVLTAPTRTRNPHLGSVLRSLRLAEREGTGVDRMYIELVRLGHAPPTFAQRDGGIRVVMQGGSPLLAVLRVHAALPASLRRSARTAVAIDLLRTRPSISEEELARAAQERPEDLRSFLGESVRAGLLQRTAAPRRNGVPAWRLTDAHQETLGSILPYFARPAEESVRLIAALARSQGEVRNQDVQDLLGLTSARASQLLKRAESDGVIKLGPGAKPMGRGTFYVLMTP